MDENARRTAMDEIAMLAELKPEAPARADELREAARARLTAEISAEAGRQRTGTPGLLGSRWVTGLREWPGLSALGGLLTGGGTGRRWRVAATVGVAAAAATAATVAVVLPGGRTPTTARSAHHSAAARPGSIVTAAWAVRRKSDGHVTLTLKEWHATSPAALQRALRAEGVRAIVGVIPKKSVIVGGQTDYYAGCSYRNLDTAPANVQKAVVRQVLPSGNKADLEWIINPSAMPPGSTLFVEVGYMAYIPQVLEGGRLVVSYLLRSDFSDLNVAEAFSEGIIDYLRAVEGAEMAALIREPPRREGPARRISLRASNDELDVSAIARKSGGGGHRQAAGFSSDASVDEITDFLHREFRAATGA